MIEMTFLQFLVALCMSLGALCIFVWAVLSGYMSDVEEIKHQVLEVEKDV